MPVTVAVKYGIIGFPILHVKTQIQDRPRFTPCALRSPQPPFSGRILLAGLARRRRASPLGVGAEGNTLDLSKLLTLVESLPGFARLSQDVWQKKQGCVTAMPAAWPYLVAALRQAMPMPILVITARPESARRFYEQALVWCPSANVLLFPEPDVLPYERLTPDFATVQARLRVLSTLRHCQNQDQKSNRLIVVNSVYAVAQKTIPRSAFDAASHTIKAGATVHLDALLEKWNALGYEPEGTVEVAGTFSRRGGILDIFPHGSPWPVRLELAGNQIESLRFFDPTTQRSRELIHEITVGPAMEMLPRSDDASRIPDWLKELQLDKCNDATRQRVSEELEAIRNGQQIAGMAFYAPLFNTDTVLDYLPPQSLVVFEQGSRLEKALGEIEEEAEELRREEEEKGDLPPGFPSPYVRWPELDTRLRSMRPGLELLAMEAETGTQNCHLFEFGAVPGYIGQLQTFVHDILRMKQEKRHIVIVSHQAPRLKDLLAEQDILVGDSSRLLELPSAGDVSLVQGILDGGWVLKDAAGADYVLLTDKEIFGFVKQRREVTRRPVRRQLFLSELLPGEYVVHSDHGIARFSGTTRLTTDGVEREYLVLDYAEGDKLYVPLEQVDRVTRYVKPGDEAPTLSRLGTQEWKRTRQRAKEAAEAVAAELLSIYAARELRPGYAFSPDTVWQQEMEASFPYAETLDQLEAVQQVKEDMERPRPMERLVCGDVGYGKTEVALRAAFKCVMDGKQAVMLVPTTILAQQHFNTFNERLKAFPIKVEVLSRFRSEKEQQAVVEGLALGTVDICIGTHRLLQKDVSFKNLGLVIIDEEQRFGVLHKEHYKKMLQEVDVLTLSATPIPRTLYMSLVSVRDMSTIETPPEERLPIKTIVGQFNERVIREAILKEMERDGQAFFVHNRVQSIIGVAERLRQLVPEAQIAVGHGQMPEEALEKVMLEFSEGQSNVLVCTTIIESGLDMPNVNTLIVNEADRLGLTQLYQLRGRVGRGTNRAYAYFLYGKGKRLTSAAEKRLQAIFEATELGAGFHLAMKDLEIRGAGNLLGTEQSGHITAVGFELYVQLLAEAVEELKAARAAGEKEKAVADKHGALPSIDLPLSAYIPETYVPDLGVRLNLYQRMARIGTENEIDDVSKELLDRFGKPPGPTHNLLYILRIRTIAQQAGLLSIASENGQIVLKFPDRGAWSGAGLEGKYQGLKVGWNQLRLAKNQAPPRRRQEVLEKLLRELASLNKH